MIFGYVHCAVAPLHPERLSMIEILTVCTGNICRSPLAEQILASRLAAFSPRVSSAGTQGLDAAPMPDDAQRLAVSLGVDATVAASHRSRYMTAADLSTPDLVLALSREHRRRVVEIAPAKLRSTFTVREFARLAAEATDDEIRSAATSGGEDPRARLRAALATVTSMRGIAAPPATPDDDDVIDPYRRSWETYQLSASQLTPALDQVVRVVSLALTPA